MGRLSHMTPRAARLFMARAHGWKMPGGGGPSVALAKEVVAKKRGSALFRRAARLKPSKKRSS